MEARTTRRGTNCETDLPVHRAVVALVVDEQVGVVDAAVRVAVRRAFVEAAERQPEAELCGELSVARDERAGERLGGVGRRAGARAHVREALWQGEEVDALALGLGHERAALAQVLLLVVARAQLAQAQAAHVVAARGFARRRALRLGSAAEGAGSVDGPPHARGT